MKRLNIVCSISIIGSLLLLTGCAGLNRSGPSSSPAPNPGNSGGSTSTPPGNSTVINHIVFMFEENRSFDHYFGHLNSYRKANSWGGASDVDTIDALSLIPTNPADASALISWSSTNATSVAINGATENSTSGSMTVMPTTATLYTAVATSSSGATAQASVVVGTSPDGSQPQIVVGASPMNVTPGGTAQLTWATTDGSTVTTTPAPDPLHTQAYGPNASAKVIVPSTPGSVTYNFSSSSGHSASVTLTVAPTASGTPTITITHNNQGHVSYGSALNVQSTLLKDQCVEDLSSDWLESHGAYNRDDPSSNTWKGDGFVHIAAGFAQFANSKNDPHHYYDVAGTRAMGYYDETMLPLYYFLAGQFATSDRWFSPMPGNTPANRFAELAATTHGYAHQPPQLDIPNIFQLVSNAGVSWKVYYSDVSPSGEPLTTLTNFVWGSQHADAAHLAPVDCTSPTTPCASGQTDYFTDLKSGNFPAVVLIEPGFDSGRDEHPGNPVQVGAAYAEKLMQSFMSSPIWSSSVFFLTFDESGGLYDHVQPMAAVQPDGIAPVDLLPKDPPGDFTRSGFRLPLMVVSPYAKPHFVSHQPSDNTAILKFIEERFNLPNLSKRDAAQPDLDFFDFTKASWATPPGLPALPAPAACALYVKNP